MLKRWQTYWNTLFLVLLAVSTGVAVADLNSGPRRGAALALAAGLAAWYWHEVVRTGRALGGRGAALPSLAAAAALWTPLLVLHWIFQLLMFTAYHLACSVPRPGRRAVPRITVVSALVVATAWMRTGFQPLDLVFYGAVTVALGLFVTMTQAIHEQNEQRRALLEQLESACGELAASERRAGVLAERQRLAREIHDTLAQGFAPRPALTPTAWLPARKANSSRTRRRLCCGRRRRRWRTCASTLALTAGQSRGRAASRFPTAPPPGAAVYQKRTKGLFVM